MPFSSEIHIGDRRVSQGDPVFIIAEAGVNHGGDIGLARQLIEVAAEAGADAVKFQAFRTHALILEDVTKAPYQQLTTGAERSQADMLRELDLSPGQYAELRDYALDRGLVFLITPFDDISLSELDKLDVPAFKVSSTDTTNLPFLSRVAARGRPMILSTGMCYFDEVRRALAEIEPINPDVVLLQCTANYPVDEAEVNLRVMQTYREQLAVLVGFSDHTPGLGATPYAVAHGARVIEKHFTLSRAMAGPDHAASLEPGELRALVAEVRRVERLLGSATKQPTESERETRRSLQKSLVAARDIACGELFSSENLVAKRAGGRGISPIRCHELFGLRALRNYVADELVDEPGASGETPAGPRARK